MPLHSIDYMNARRDAKPASGGKRQVALSSKRDEYRRADRRCQLAALDAFERIQEELAEAHADAMREFAAVRALVRSLATLAPGESLDDLSF